MQNAIYLRKSRADENAIESIEETLSRHKRILLEFATKNKIPITDIYEEVVSGDSIVSRPEMMKLLDAVDAGKYDAVICMDIDRLGRGGMRDQGLILDTFKHSNTLIITPEKTYDLTNELDEELTEFKTFMSRREYKIITKRLQRGLMQTINDGAYVANAPFGYKKAIIDKLPSLEIVPEEAEVIKMMFDMYVNQRIGTHSISETLNAMGIIPRRNGTFSRSTVRTILRNPVYAGKISWNKVTRKKSPSTGKRVATHHDYQDWLMIDGKHEPIIDIETYYKAQEIRTRRNLPAYNTGNYKNPLAGLVICSKCGTKLQKHVCRGKYDYIRCTTQGCTGSANFDEVEAAVLDILQKEWTSLSTSAKSIDTTGVDFQIAQAQKERDELLKIRENLLDFLERGIYTLELFTERMETLKAKMQSNQSFITECEEKRDAIIGTDKKELMRKIRYVLDHYATADTNSRNIMLKTVVNNVIYSREYGGTNEFSLDLKLKI